MAVEKPQGNLSNYETFRDELGHDYSDVSEYAALA